MYTRTLALGLMFLLPGLLCAQSGPIYRFQTNLGDIDVELYPDVAPKTVANFLNYVNKGAYTSTIIHRSVRGFVVQGGGFRISGQSVNPIPPDPPVENEFRVSNTRGTIAMAKQEGNPNSATNQWYFNLADNSAVLDPQNGGFTVFGKILNASGLAVLDRIAATPTYTSPWATNDATGSGGTPLLDYRQGTVVQPSNFISIQSIRPAARAISAGAFGAFTEAAAGSYLEIYGTDLAGTTRTWAEADFRNGAAPTTVDNVSVTVGGQPAFVSYVSPTQVNVQIPSGVALGAAVPVVVTYNGAEKAIANVAVRAVAPGLLAPEAFRVGDFQYVVAQHADGSFVGNGLVPNVPAAPARAGETLTIYGVGFGPLSGGSPVAGQIAQGLTSLSNPVQFFFADRQAELTYAGLVPGLVGLYQFNVVVPAGLEQDVPLRVTVNGSNIAQTLWIPVSPR